MQTKVNASEVSYELHSLGWKGFQNLCVSLAGEVWGQTVQSFSDSKDAGRDGAFHGTWNRTEGESFEGAFTAQCKFTSKSNKILHLSDLKGELTKAKRLASRGLADTYILFTNAQLTGVNEEKIRRAFKSNTDIRHFAAYGIERISRIIQESPRLRMLVPRVYGLGDLSQIIDERGYAQARELLSALGDDLGKFVITDAYRKSAKALAEHGFVLLLGEPACGKSTIAAALAVGALDVWESPTMKIRNADDFIKHWNPDEIKQFFWVDDAFGATQFDLSSATGWNRVFPNIHAALRRGARVLFTSRDYIYRSARNHLKESSFPLIHKSQVIIHVEQLTEEERNQILYNHIRLGTQPKQFKTQIKRYLPDVATHSSFSPEIARRLGSPIFTKNISITKSGMDRFVAHPVELLREIIRTLDADSRSALAVVFIRGGTIPSPMSMTNDEEKAVDLIGGSKAGVRNAVNSLEGSLLLKVRKGSSYFWMFKHPTIQDAFASLVAEDRELMDIYLTGMPIKKLFQEVSCGDVGLEGVKVFIPADRYDGLISRIETFYNIDRWENKNAVHSFLSYRCDREFLAQFLVKNPNFISNLRVGSYLYAVSDVDVLVRLHEFDLLPEVNRLAFVASIRDLAVNTPDAGFLSERIRKVLTQQEFEEIINRVRISLIPNLDNHIDSWSSNYDYDSNQEYPEDYFSELISALNEYKEILAVDESVCEKIDMALAKIDGEIEDLHSYIPEEPDSDDFYSGNPEDYMGDESRSIFDDVDQ